NGTEFLSLQYEFTNPTLRGFGGSYAQYLSPAINGLILFAFEPDTGYVCVKGTIDDFPAVAIHQVHYDADGKVSAATKPVTLADHKESESLLGLMDPFHWTETHIGNQCGQSLTGSSPVNSPVNPLENVDWMRVVTQTELGCDNPDYGPHLGVEVDAKQFADVT